jgi:hypothetical protein
VVGRVVAGRIPREEDGVELVEDVLVVRLRVVLRGAVDLDRDLGVGLPMIPPKISPRDSGCRMFRDCQRSFSMTESFTARS